MKLFCLKVNVEHRTFNIEHPMLMALRTIYFIKSIEYRIRRWTFNVRRSLVSSSIKLVATATSGCADFWLLNSPGHLLLRA
ncbi:MAG: hypothetical protein QF876_13600 [Desulfobacterales bacterium]|nr:hypothetical protein [Desulfobacterales bacterium]MDP6808994.1 hypothetical protein [Desulfobacterales bacterium]